MKKHKWEYTTIRINKNKTGMRHRLLMEQYLGKKLKSNEVVHHKNGNKRDDRLKNLEVQPLSQHTSEFMKKFWKKCKNGKYWCNGCKKYLPKDNFWIRKNKPEEMRASCKRCESKNRCEFFKEHRY